MLFKMFEKMKLQYMPASTVIFHSESDSQVFLILLLCGDIEENPGPNIKVTQGSFHQGDARFGQSAGTQCMCNALFSIFFSAVKRVYHWSTGDLDYILTEGNRIYVGLGQTSSYLSVDELPHQISMEGQAIQMVPLVDIGGVLSGDFFVNLLERIGYCGNGIIMIIAGYSFSMIWSNSSIHLFDSHAKDQNGFPSPEGKSVLLKFQTIRDVQSYLMQLYPPIIDESPKLFQILCVQVDISPNVKNVISTALKKKSRSSKRTSSEAQTNSSEAKTKQQLFPPQKRPRLSEKYLTKSIETFKRKARQGPFYICVICHRTFYKQTVRIFSRGDYKVSDFVFEHRIESFDGKEYVCTNCHTKSIKGQIPCQAVCNDLELYDLPKELRNVRRLEKVIISKRILFKKIAIMPKGRFPKLKGAICNVPITVDDICNILPRGMDNNGVVQVALKKRLRFKSNVYFEAVRPHIIERLLRFLKENNPMYSDIHINISNIPRNWINGISSDEEIPEVEFVDDSVPEKITLFEQDDCLPEDRTNLVLEDEENPLDQHRLSSQATTMVPETFYNISDDNILSIAPGEDKTPLPIFSDENCEVLAHPTLFPTGKFGYSVKRDIPLSPSRYFNQRLLNYSQRFASDSDYIFFAQSVLQQQSLHNSINIAMQKVKSKDLTAGVLSKNFKQRVASLVANDEAYSFMKQVKGSPAYWKKFLFDVLAMVKQLGLPTYFMTLSCADLRWNELIEIISKLNKTNLDEEKINKLDYYERTDILNSNPVLLARHFQYRVETFFQEIVKNGQLGKVIHYAIRVEFQVRGSPHIHSLLWVEDAPILKETNINEYIDFVDGTVSCTLPDRMHSPELHKLVKTYQTHSHSKSCRKYKNTECRYHFGKYFTSRTIIAQPLSSNLSENECKTILHERKGILNKVKQYIDTQLNPRLVNMHEAADDDYQPPQTIPEILQYLHINEEDYYRYLSISPDNSFHIHFRREPDSCFVNNYFSQGLTAWEANLDIQPVLDYYKAVSYMCAYLSKSEDESSEAMKQAAAEANESGSTVFEKMKSIAKAYKTHREMSTQEAVGIVTAGIWFHKTSPEVTFINTNLPENRYRIFRPLEEILELPEDSTDLFKRNMLDRYMDRPNETFRKGRYRLIDNMCFAQFSANYVLDSRSKNEDINDQQPEILEKEFLEEENVDNFPKSLPLMNSKERLRLRKKKCVTRYHLPNSTTKPEAYANHLLTLFYPFRKENELRSGPTGSYSDKLSQVNVLEIVNRNKMICEPYGDQVDEAFVHLNARTNDLDPTGEQENDDVMNEIAQNGASDSEEDTEERPSSSESSVNQMSALISDEELNEKIRSLNDDQRKYFEVVNKWTRNLIKSQSSKRPKEKEPLYMFLTGSAGCGKSHLLTVIKHYLLKSLSYKAKNLDKDRILMLALTGVAAVHVDGSTIHSSLCIAPERKFGKKIPRMSDKRRCLLRNKLSEVCIIIIDEVSMVSNELLLHIHQRLVEIFGCELPFAGLSVICCGDFYQLPPILANLIFAKFNKALLNISPLWEHFKLAELTEVMRQKGDQTFIDLLNNIRVGKLLDKDKEILMGRFISRTDVDYPLDAMHIWAENKPVNDHNEFMLKHLSGAEVHIPALDKIPACGLSESTIRKFNDRSQMSTGGLSQTLILKIGAKVMLTTNVDVEDKLCNGQIGVVKKFKYDNDGSIHKIYLKMDEENVGLKAMRSDKTGRSEKLVCIERVGKDIKINDRSPSSPTINRSQFPLALSWACTVHKVQGKTFNRIVFCFDLFKQKRFNFGQIYVALSRVKSLEGLYLTGKFDENCIKVDPRVKKEYEHLRNNCMLTPIIDLPPIARNSLTITLLNVRSLQKHAIDVAKDKSLMQSEILCFTETQMTSSSFDNTESKLRDVLSPFSLDANNTSDDKFCNLAVAFTDSIQILESVKVPCASFFQISKVSFYTAPLNFLLLYKKNSLEKEDFAYIIQHFKDRYSPHIILGDINVDAFNSNNFMHNLLSSEYQMIVNEATHISGSLIDHVYVHRSLLNSIFEVESLVKSVYFSDHEAVKIVLQN